jgi:hypothetical protein
LGAGFGFHGRHLDSIIGPPVGEDPWQSIVSNSGAKLFEYVEKMDKKLVSVDTICFGEEILGQHGFSHLG